LFTNLTLLYFAIFFDIDAASVNLPFVTNHLTDSGILTRYKQFCRALVSWQLIEYNTSVAKWSMKQTLTWLVRLPKIFPLSLQQLLSWEQFNIANEKVTHCRICTDAPWITLRTFFYI
jgi:hypothetical protein